MPELVPPLLGLLRLPELAVAACRLRLLAGPRKNYARSGVAGRKKRGFCGPDFSKGSQK
ncbi:MAG: hypothetical protein NVS1B16_14960 [Pseudarthrobacter sp.]